MKLTEGQLLISLAIAVAVIALVIRQGMDKAGGGSDPGGVSTGGGWGGVSTGGVVLTAAEFCAKEPERCKEGAAYAKEGMLYVGGGLVSAGTAVAGSTAGAAAAATAGTMAVVAGSAATGGEIADRVAKYCPCSHPYRVSGWMNLPKCYESATALKNSGFMGNPPCNANFTFADKKYCWKPVTTKKPVCKATDRACVDPEKPCKDKYHMCFYKKDFTCSP
ncbi:MAG: hypothetical protein CMA10_04490 [Euryarchaeota archaeon]|nr:hypothetical protein [Euryarchaeota archaeon]